MSAIFVSHSSSDSDAAALISEHLVAEGHRSVFLDFDPEHGIPAGRDWEREIYQQLKACQAVVVLCSRASMASRWCFAEVTQAKSLGKHLFPVLIEECEVPPIIASTQMVHLSEEPGDALQRLTRGLVLAGLDPKSSFDWDSTRPPYPGLLAFQEEDAAVYFGRGEEIHEGIATLNQLWQVGDGTGLLVLGPSGTGKSSLIRAGLLPRLRRDPTRWVVVGPFRPGGRPWQALAMALAKSYESFGGSRDWRELRDELEESDGAELPAICADLAIIADRPEARVLFTVDQLEEVLAAGDGGSAFLAGFSNALLREGAMFLGALRSDFLRALQNDPGAQRLRYRDLMVLPLPRDRIAQIIEGPASRCGLEFEDGLTHAMVEDCERGDALPLLAFALRELFERHGGDGRLTRDEYDDIGGLQGAVAQAADQAFGKSSEVVARSTFLFLVRVNDEGAIVRRAMRWSDVADDARPLIERFVEARLLVTDQREGRRVVEVAHEALIRSWDRFRRWVSADREFLLWRRRLGHNIREWERASRDPRVLLDGPVLEEAGRWVADRGGELSEQESTFVAASQDRDFLIWKRGLGTQLSRWRESIPEAVPMERRSWLLTAAVTLPNLVAWFLPAAYYGDVVPGWEAFLLALQSAFTDLESWHQPVWLASALTNVWFLVGLVSLLGWRFIPAQVRFRGAVAAVCLNAYWVSYALLFEPELELRIGYYLWWASFWMLAAALHPAPRTRRADDGTDALLEEETGQEAWHWLTTRPADFDDSERDFITDSRSLHRNRYLRRRARLAAVALGVSIASVPAVQAVYEFTEGGVEGVRRRIVWEIEGTRRAHLSTVERGYDTASVAGAFEELVLAYQHDRTDLVRRLTEHPAVLIPVLDSIEYQLPDGTPRREALRRLQALPLSVIEDSSLRKRAEELEECLTSTADACAGRADRDD